MCWSGANPDPDCQRRARSWRSSWWIEVVAICVLIAQSLSAGEVPGEVQAFFEKHCFECHDQQSKKGGMDLTSQALDLVDTTTFLRWVRLHDRVQSSEMPPKDSPRPGAEEIKPVLEWLSQTLRAEELQWREKNGRSVVRRMNRTEFENTLRDLLDVPWIEVQESLPDDGRADGYTKTAAALDVSPVLLAKYAEAIDKALDAAVAKWSVPP